MNETTRKITLFGLCLAIVITILCAIQTHRLDKSIQQCEYYRTELERAESQQRLLTDTIDKCFDSTERTREILSRATSNVGQLKQQLEEVRVQYQDLEVRLLDFYDKFGNRYYN